MVGEPAGEAAWLGEDPGWTALSACRSMNTEVFFAATEEADEIALAVCASCPVRIPCRDWALENREPFGVWGGMTERERRRIFRRERRQRAAERRREQEAA